MYNYKNIQYRDVKVYNKYYLYNLKKCVFMSNDYDMDGRFESRLAKITHQGDMNRK